MKDERNQLRLEMEKEMTTEEKTVNGSDIVTLAFNFDKWKQDTMDGLRLMESERDMLRQERQRIDERISTLDRDIAALQTVTTTFDQEDEGRRDSYVKVTLAALAKDRLQAWTDLDSVTAILREEKPSVKESSVRSAIARLVRDGVLIQDPPVGELPKGTRADRRWKYNPTYQPEIKVVVEATGQSPKQKIADGILRLMSHKPDGITGKDLAWLATDLGVEVEEISEVINTKMAEGTMETAMENGVDILRAKAPPGSKEDLKRTKIVDRPLFPDMERPEHA